MSKKFIINALPSLLLLVLVACSVAGMFFIAKEANTVVYIKNEKDFDKIRDDLNGHYVLSPDSAFFIKDDWVPIGTKEKPFTGFIEGNNFSIYFNSSFSTDYIESQKGLDESIFGFIGYNSGIIKHLNVVYSANAIASFADISTKSLTFGGISSHNDSYITGCKTIVPKVSFTERCNSINFGGIVGINNGQLQGCSVDSHFDVTANTNINAGCFAAVSKPNSIIKYCFRSGYSFFKIAGEKSDFKPICNFGFCVGLCQGGIFENLSFSSSNNSNHTYTTVKLFDSGRPSAANFGGIIGCLNSPSIVKINKIVVDFDTSIYVDNLNFGGVIGLVNSNSAIQVSNSCCSGNASNLRSESSNNFGIIFGYNSTGSNITTNNNFYYDLSTNVENFSYQGSTQKDYKTLKLSDLGYEETVWEKGKFSFYLTYGKE